MMMMYRCVTRQSDSNTVLRNHSSALSIYSSPHISGRYKIEGGHMDSQHDALGRPAESHTSQLDLIVVSRASDKTRSFVQLFCDWGR
jgi:hypothetical protein